MNIEQKLKKFLKRKSNIVKFQDILSLIGKEFETSDEEFRVVEVEHIPCLLNDRWINKIILFHRDSDCKKDTYFAFNYHSIFIDNVCTYEIDAESLIEVFPISVHSYKFKSQSELDKNEKLKVRMETCLRDELAYIEIEEHELLDLRVNKYLSSIINYKK